MTFPTRVLFPISIHALREEGDAKTESVPLGELKFLSTPSARRATRGLRMVPRWGRYFYPRPPRGGRHFYSESIHSSGTISIHALREEGDYRNYGPPCGGSYFYPRPPRGGRPDGQGKVYTIRGISIHALREEGDHLSAVAVVVHQDFYPRPPRGGRLPDPAAVWCMMDISIHALREEGDGAWWTPQDNWDIFLSTPSARRATKTKAAASVPKHNFYPRPPRGGRHGVIEGIKAERLISIHALREEGDAACNEVGRNVNDFYPRPPRGGRHL